MTTADLLALKNHAAALEAEGLPRRDAVMAAFKRYPECLQECREVAGQDNENALYAFLEYVLEGPQSTLGGLHASAEAETVELRGKAPENAPRALKTREGIEALEYMLSQGIPLIGNYESGASINKGKAQGDPQEKAYTSDLKTIKSLMAGQGDKHGRAKGTQIRRFSFRPHAAGLFCLDIDRKPNKPDGLKELQKVFDLATLPDELTDIESHFPCYVKTPNNGYHLYFKYTGAPIKKADLFTSIELKYDQLTAPGSVNKDGKPYVLYGAIENAPPLFGLILDKIQKAGKQAGQEKQVPQKAAADRTSYTPPTYTEKQRITLDDLAMETTGGNHDKQVQFAGKAFRCGYTANEALDYVKSRPDIFGTGADTANTIYSVFRDNGGM